MQKVHFLVRKLSIQSFAVATIKFSATNKCLQCSWSGVSYSLLSLSSGKSGALRIVLGFPGHIPACAMHVFSYFFYISQNSLKPWQVGSFACKSLKILVERSENCFSFFRFLAYDISQS